MQAIYKNFKESSSFENSQNPKIHATSLAQELAERFEIVVDPHTITKNLNNEGFYRRAAHKKPPISEKTRALRLKFAKKAYK